MTPPLPYTVVIPTSGRSQLLGGVMESLAVQAHRPQRIVVVDAAKDEAGAVICRDWSSRLPVDHQRARVMSAALQRNQGAENLATPVVVFCDDDMTFAPDVMARLASALDSGDTPRCGAAARIEGFTHRRPGRALHAYYRWQAGYDHPHYGARLFGPAINCWPCYEAEAGPLIRADWLNSALVAYRSDIFSSERFPEFQGYSYMEDVHLSARIGRHGPLVFDAGAVAQHHGISTSDRIRRAELVEMQWRNRALIAREIMKTPPARLRRQLQAHRAFVALYLIRARPAGWREELKALNRLSFSS